MRLSSYMSRVALFMCVALLSSCSNITIFPTPTPEPLSAWINKWLNEPTCQVPCWENLIPGETNIADSPKILSDVPDVKITWYPSEISVAGYQQIMWDFTNPSGGGSATTEKNGQEIATIELTISNTQNLRIKQVFSSYGFPSDVFLYDCRGEIMAKACVVHLIYRENGMALELLLPNVGKNTNQVTLQENSSVFRIWFFSLGDNAYGEALGKNSGNFPKDVVEWKGFEQYP